MFEQPAYVHNRRYGPFGRDLLDYEVHATRKSTVFIALEDLGGCALVSFKDGRTSKDKEVR